MRGPMAMTSWPTKARRLGLRSTVTITESMRCTGSTPPLMVGCSWLRRPTASSNASVPLLVANSCLPTVGSHTEADRQENDAALVDELMRSFRDQIGVGLGGRTLTAAGVGCVRADGIEVDRFITSDPHMLENEWAPMVDHTRFGRLRRWGPVVTVGGPNPDYRSAPLAGEQTDAILTELGHNADEIRQLRDAKVVNSEPV